MLTPLFQKARVDATLRKMLIRFECLRKKRPENLSGLNMLAESMIKAHRIMKAKDVDVFENQKEGLTLAAQTWTTLSAETKREWEGIAIVERAVRREARDKELNDLREKIRIQEENIAAKRKEKGCLGLVDDIRFCESATSKMQCMFEDAEYKGAALQALRKEAEKPPEVPDKYGLAVLLEQPFFKPPWLVKAAPGWLAPVTKQREHFQDTAFHFGSDESQPWWLFTYSMITPAQVTLLPLSMEEGMEMPDLSFELCQSAAHLWRRRQFFVAENYKFLHEFNFPDVPWRDIYIQPGLVWMKPGHLGTSLDPLSLDEYLSNLPYIAYGQGSNKSRREGYAAPSARIRMTPEEEWLAEFKRKKAQGNSHQTCNISACKKEIRQLDEEELKEVYEIVETIRARFQDKAFGLT